MVFRPRVNVEVAGNCRQTDDIASTRREKRCQRAPTGETDQLKRSCWPRRYQLLKHFIDRSDDGFAIAMTGPVALIARRVLLVGLILARAGHVEDRLRRVFERELECHRVRRRRIIRWPRPGCPGTTVTLDIDVNHVPRSETFVPDLQSAN